MAPPWTERFSHSGVPSAPTMTAWFDALRLFGSDVKQARRWLVATGILALLGGGAVIIVPPIATLTMTIFIGWILVYLGVVMAIDTGPSEPPADRGSGRCRRCSRSACTWSCSRAMAHSRSRCCS